MSENKLLSRRVQFPSTLDMAEKYSHSFVNEFNLSQDDRVKVETALRNIFESFLSETVFAMIKGATRGIEEASCLIQDADYYETVKKRDTSSRQRRKEWQEQEIAREKERDRRKNNPTIEEQQADVRNAINEMIYAKDRYEQHRRAIKSFREKYDDSLIAEVIKKKYPIPEVWSESFDIDDFVARLTFSKIADEVEEENKIEGDNVFSLVDWKGK